MLPALIVATAMPMGKVIFLWALWILMGEAFPLAVLVCCWWVGDLTFRTKVVFTLLYLGHFGLLFTAAPYLYLVAKPVLIVVIGGATFGWEWLTSGWPPGQRK